MADAQRIIELVFNGVDKSGAAVQSVLNNTNKLSQGIQDATQPIADFTLGALKFEAALLAAGTAATLFAVKTAGDFDSAFREISTLIDKPIGDLGDFRQAILNYANSSTQPLNEVTQSIYSAISAGVGYADSIAVVAQAERLAVAGKAGLNDSLVVLVSSLNAYGLGMESAERFSDALFTTVKLGQTTLPELSGGLANITGAAAALEIPFETLQAVIATLTASGTPTAQAITQIGAVMTALIKPSKEASDTAAELGIEFGAQAVKAKGLSGVLTDVATATGGNEEQMAKLFGSVEALKAVFPLTGQAADKFAENLAAMQNSSGATQTAFEKMSESLNLEATKIANSFKVMMVAVGDPLLDEFGDIADAIVAIFSAITGNVQNGGLSDLVKYIETLMGELGDTLEGVAENLPAALAKADFSSFKGGVEAVVTAVKLLFDNIDLSTVDGLKVAIETVGAAFLSLSNFTAGVIESFKPLFDIFVKIASNVNGVDESFGKASGSFAGFATQVNSVAGMLPSFTGWLETLLGILVLKNAGGMVAGLSAAAGGAKALSVALAGAGLGGALVYASLEADTLFDKLVNLEVGFGRTKTPLGQFLTSILGAPPVVSRFGESIDDLLVPLESLRRPVDIDSLLIPLGDLTYQSKLTSDQMQILSGSMLNHLAATRDGASAAFEYAGSLQEQEDKISGLVPIIDDITGAIIGYDDSAAKASTAINGLGDAAKGGAGSISKISEATKKAEEAQRSWNQELQKMQFETGLALIEQQTEITTTRILAQADIIGAAYESINVSIQSTGDTITDLYGIMAGGGLNISERWELADQIEIENERRGESLDLQKRMTEAVIKEMEAKTQALNRGDPIITINGDGLAPHLEAFMFEVLKGVQLSVNRDGYEMLLGV